MDHPSGTLIVIPVYNDWGAVTMLMDALDTSLTSAGISARVLLVDDGSTVRQSLGEPVTPFSSIPNVYLLRLRRNVGHQRAIAIGLTYVEEHSDADEIVVMDGDGEDSPSDVPRLLNALRARESPTIIFAARTKRSEGLGFRASYWLYRKLHRLVTGISVNIGNFSAMPRATLRQLVVVSELWNHYAASVVRARLSHETIATKRANRLAGKPTMNFVALVAHGLSALAVHGEVVGVRLLVATLALLALSLALTAAVVVIRFATALAIPGWATTAGGLSLILVTQLLLLSGLFTMFTLASRAASNFIPLRDYGYFLDGPAVELTAGRGLAPLVTKPAPA